eukprot:scaffold3261_cov67-Phaeocystis_antarctica.AAC.11
MQLNKTTSSAAHRLCKLIRKNRPRDFSPRGMAASWESASSDEHGAPTEERNLTLDERVLRGKSEHTCLKRLDELMYCLSEHLRQPPTA